MNFGFKIKNTKMNRKLKKTKDPKNVTEKEESIENSL